MAMNRRRRMESAVSNSECMEEDRNEDSDNSSFEDDEFSSESGSDEDGDEYSSFGSSSVSSLNDMDTDSSSSSSSSDYDYDPRDGAPPQHCSPSTKTSQSAKWAVNDINPVMMTMTNSVRNRNKFQAGYKDNDNDNDKDTALEDYPSDSDKKHKYKQRQRRQSTRSTPPSHTNKITNNLLLRYYIQGWRNICTKRSTTIFFMILLLYFYTQIQIIRHHHHHHHHQSSLDSYADKYNTPLTLQQRAQELRSKRSENALQALGNAAGQFFRPKRRRRDSSDAGSTVENLPSGCHAPSWQTYSFPNCNDIHEIDLQSALNLVKHGEKIPADLGEGDKSDQILTRAEKLKAAKMGYVGSGLWRQVWKVDPRGEMVHVPPTFQEGQVVPAVLKIMKQEHPFDPRNFDRHRRDALVMERMTYSNHVVSIYGFCGNTVLTEYAGKTLHDVIYDEDEQEQDQLQQQQQHQQQQPTFTRNTPEGRIRLALDVMRGLQAIHEIPDGPILHADIQTKQFLVHPVHGVKLNDFNRCRFMPRRNDTNAICKIRIPSAPGGNRSPEEYEQERLTEKIDVFSAANILFGILTGTRPWDTLRKADIRKSIMSKKTPRIHSKFRARGTMDAALADIIENMYQFQPNQRHSAKEIVEQLEELLYTHHSNKYTNNNNSNHNINNSTFHDIVNLELPKLEQDDLKETRNTQDRNKQDDDHDNPSLRRRIV